MRMDGSLQNRIMELGVIGQPTPFVGMGATEIMYTDRRAYEIVRVEEKNGVVKRFWMKPCHVKYSYPSGYGEVGEVIEDAGEYEVRQNKRGQWCIVGKKYRNDGTEYFGITQCVVRLESRGKGQAYQDPSF